MLVAPDYENFISSIALLHLGKLLVYLKNISMNLLHHFVCTLIMSLLKFLDKLYGERLRCQPTVSTFYVIFHFSMT